MSKRSALLLVNPAAGRGGFVRGDRASWRLLRIVDLLSRRYEVDWQCTTAPGDGTQQARTAARNGVHAVFALGGDGTLRECAAGLLGTDVPLGLLAGGTTNVLVPSLGLPRNAMEAAERYASSDAHHSGKPPVRPLDVGLCAGHPFLMMMSRGLDSRALLNTSKLFKRRLGRIAVGWSALREFLRHPEPMFETAHDPLPQTSLPAGGDAGAPRQSVLHSSFLGVCNVQHYAGGFVLAPNASPWDGHLDLVLLNRCGRWPTARFAAHVATSTLASRKRKTGDDHKLPRDIQRGRVRRVELRGQGEALLQLDGDPLRVELPVVVELAKARLLLLWPR